MSEMHEVALSSQSSSLEGTMQNVSSMGGMPTHKLETSGFASVGHLDGSVSIWNLNMRQCFAS